jgi:hypothetical protein
VPWIGTSSQIYTTNCIYILTRILLQVCIKNICRIWKKLNRRSNLGPIESSISTKCARFINCCRILSDIKTVCLIISSMSRFCIIYCQYLTVLNSVLILQGKRKKTKTARRKRRNNALLFVALDSLIYLFIIIKPTFKGNKNSARVLPYLATPVKQSTKKKCIRSSQFGPDLR